MEILNYSKYAEQFESIKINNEMDYTTKCKLCIDMYWFIKKRRLESEAFDNLLSDIAEYITIIRKL